jgi:hypothetical protein
MAAEVASSSSVPSVALDIEGGGARAHAPGAAKRYRASARAEREWRRRRRRRQATGSSYSVALRLSEKEEVYCCVNQDSCREVCLLRRVTNCDRVRGFLRSYEVMIEDFSCLLVKLRCWCAPHRLSLVHVLLAVFSVTAALVQYTDFCRWQGHRDDVRHFGDVCVGNNVSEMSSEDRDECFRLYTDIFEESDGKKLRTGCSFKCRLY